MAKDPITDCQAWTLGRIPEASRVKCIYGGGDINASEYGIFQVVEGLAEKRRDGGTHALSNPKRRFEFACGVCTAKESAGLTGQEQLEL